MQLPCTLGVSLQLILCQRGQVVTRIFVPALSRKPLWIFHIQISPSRSFITLTREQCPILVLFISLILLFFLKSNRIFSELRLWCTARYPVGRISKVFLIGWGLDLNSNRFSCRLKFQNRFKRLLLLVVRRKLQNVKLNSGYVANKSSFFNSNEATGTQLVLWPISMQGLNDLQAKTIAFEIASRPYWSARCFIVEQFQSESFSL